MIGAAVALSLAGVASSMAWLAGALGTDAVLGLQGLVAIFACAWLHRRGQPFATVAVAALLLGPLAGPVLLIAALHPATGATTEAGATRRHLLRPFTRGERLWWQMTEARRPRMDRPVPPALAAVFDDGDLRQQQSALAALARGYGPVLRPALDRALASDIPAVRVQAAAVFAHLRDTYADRARTALASGEPPTRDEITTLCASGFVDERTRERLLARLPKPRLVPAPASGGATRARSAA